MLVCQTFRGEEERSGGKSREEEEPKTKEEERAAVCLRAANRQRALALLADFQKQTESGSPAAPTGSCSENGVTIERMLRGRKIGLVSAAIR